MYPGQALHNFCRICGMYKLPCVHRLEVICTVTSGCCNAAISLCKIHQICSLKRLAPERLIDGVKPAVCSRCLDRKPPDDG
jgi:hypothetical protein